MNMTAYERLACDFYLYRYNRNGSFQDVINDIYNYDVTVKEEIDELLPDQTVEIIKKMISFLSSQFVIKGI